MIFSFSSKFCNEQAGLERLPRFWANSDRGLCVHLESLERSLGTPGEASLTTEDKFGYEVRDEKGLRQRVSHVSL